MTNINPTPTSSTFSPLNGVTITQDTSNAPARDLFAASHQWANRPDDERYESLESLLQAAKHHKEAAREKTVHLSEIRAIGDSVSEEVKLIGPNGGAVDFTHYGFGQFASRVGAPATYLRGLPARLSAELLNHGIQEGVRQDPRTKVELLIHKNSSNVIRCATSEKYERIWNADVAAQVVQLTDRGGWQVPPARPARVGQKGTRPAVESDLLRLRSSGLSIQLGQPIAPAGLYLSDHDCFIFMVNESRIIETGNPKEQLARGFFVSNSEVGAASFRLTMFLYSFVCGNHIVWGARNVTDISIRHIGNRAVQFHSEMWRAIRQFSETSAQDQERKIVAARSWKLGESSKQEDVLKFVYRLGTGATQKQLAAAYDEAGKYASIHGEPDSVWGFVGGLTRVSQNTPYMDERDTLDRAAYKILDLVKV